MPLYGGTFSTLFCVLSIRSWPLSVFCSVSTEHAFNRNVSNVCSKAESLSVFRLCHRDTVLVRYKGVVWRTCKIFPIRNMYALFEGVFVP